MMGISARFVMRPALLSACAAIVSGCVGGTDAVRSVGAPAVSPRQQLEETAAKASRSQARLQEGIALNIGEDTGKEPVRQAIIPDAPQVAPTREGSVEQIRAKAAVSSGVPTNVFADREGATSGMSKADQEKARAELAAAAARNQNLVSGSDPKAKAAAARKLKQQALTHYEDALKEIEN